MKKLLVLAALVTTMSVSVASAKEFNDARWQWFYSNSDYTGKVDLNTLSYDPETDTAKAWAAWIRTTGIQDLISYKIHFSNNSLDVFDRNTYINGSDEIKRSQNFNGQNHVAAPGMGDEALIASVKGLVGRDTKLADYKKQKADEAQLQEQKRIEEQKAAEKKAKHERNRDILRGIFGI
ncbi:hypothetical protein [uncultured Veillonella sp.]|uniref:hypothetical protein n=1 Tax=uncultured Veillonella sp. TaxID=159268 RepID=UPI0028D45111|nr:hypothetical protein [uncultured Veillonella sp.]